MYDFRMMRILSASVSKAERLSTMVQECTIQSKNGADMR